MDNGQLTPTSSNPRPDFPEGAFSDGSSSDTINLNTGEFTNPAEHDTRGIAKTAISGGQELASENQVDTTQESSTLRLNSQENPTNQTEQIDLTMPPGGMGEVIEVDASPNAKSSPDISTAFDDGLSGRSIEEVKKLGQNAEKDPASYVESIRSEGGAVGKILRGFGYNSGHGEGKAA